MGNNTDSLSCCQNNTSQLELLAIDISHPIQLSKQFQDYRQAYNQVSLLTSVNHHINLIKYNKDNLAIINKQFKNVETFIQTLDQQNEYEWMVIIAHKSYQKVDSINLLHSPTSRFQHSIIFPKSQKLNQQALSLQKLASKSSIIKLFQLSKPFNTYEMYQYIQTMHNQLMSIERFKDLCWNLKIKQNYEATAEHFKYNFGRYHRLINQSLSFHDLISIHKIRQFYHFFLHYFCRNDYIYLEQQYWCSMEIFEAQTQFYQPKSWLMFHNFIEFAPFNQKQIFQNLQCEKLKVRVCFIIKPLNNSATKTKFKISQNIYYLPLTIASITEIKKIDSNLTIVYLCEQKCQYFVQQSIKPKVQDLSSSINHVAINQINILNQLISLRDKLTCDLDNLFDIQTIEKVDHLEVLSQSTYNLKKQSLIKEYYQSYLNWISNQQIKQKIDPQKNIKSQIEEHLQPIVQLPVQSARQKVEEETVQEIIEVNRVTQQKHEQILAQYIKQYKLEKLQLQIDSSSLNLSQLKLTKIEHLTCFPNLKELILFSNQITIIQGLERNQNLRLLSLARNKISNLNNLQSMIHLRELYLTKNRLEIDSVRYLLDLNIPKLKILSISFIKQPQQCLEQLFKKEWKKLEALYINQSEKLSNRFKNRLKKKLAKLSIEFFDW